MKVLMVTVVMSVYNGTRYLTEQLDSLRLQTVSPDRVLIADDCSTDESFDLIVKYIEEHGLGNWTINKNRSNSAGARALSGFSTLHL